MHIAAPIKRIERLPAVIARTGMSRSWIYKQVAAGRFPRPVKIGSASGWQADDIDRWLDALCADPHATVTLSGRG